MKVPANRRMMRSILIFFVWLLMKTAGDHRSHHHAVDGANIRIAGERACPGWAADKFVIGEAKAAAYANANDEFKSHG